MTKTIDANVLPSFLNDYGSFYSHIQDQFEGVSNQVKGQRFAEFACSIIPNTELGRRFETPNMRQPTYDGGVDLEARSLDGTELLYVQSKYTIAGVDDLAEIFDKFKAYEAKQSKESSI